DKVKDKTGIYNYTGNLNESLSIIKASKGIVATRFHSMILGWLFNKNVYPIIYSQKTDNVLSDTNLLGDFVWMQEIDKIKISSVLTQLLTGDKHDIDNEIHNAQKQFLYLDKIL